MIYEYERSVLQYLNKCFPQIRLATYSPKEDLFQAMSSVTLLPAFFYSRQSDEWTSDKLLSFVCDGIKVRGFQVSQTYTGTILVEKSVDAQSFANKLHLYWASNSTIAVPLLIKGQKKAFDVSLILKSIKVEESQSPADIKGPIRTISFSWWSNLFLGEFEAFNFSPSTYQILLDTPQESITLATV